MTNSKSPLTPRLVTPILAITMGDAAGIGPEIIIKMLHSFKQDDHNFTPIIIGNINVLSATSKQLGTNIQFHLADFKNLSRFSKSIQVVDIDFPDHEQLVMGSPTAMAGELAFQSIKKAVELSQAHQVDAIVTAPICKESLHMAGHKFDGHTGLIATLTKTSNYRMLFAAEKLKIIHVTAHIPFSDVPSHLNVDSVFQTIFLGYKHMKSLGYSHPKIAICGLNPHASENGIFGREDLEVIKPAIDLAIIEGIDATGPHPGDALFRQAFNGQYDMVVAQYHDQGHIPGKLMAFDSAVNVTLGLPIIRTSVDHGTAFDIAGKGIANSGNLSCAIDYALKLIPLSP